MAKMLCECGCEMNNGADPSNIEFYAIDDHQRLRDGLFLLTEVNFKYVIWHCQQCERLHVMSDCKNGTNKRVYGLEIEYMQ